MTYLVPQYYLINAFLHMHIYRIYCFVYTSVLLVSKVCTFHIYTEITKQLIYIYVCSSVKELSRAENKLF